jgi:Xaa-Pro dipeptidase
MTREDYEAKIDPIKRAPTGLIGNINPNEDGNPALHEWDQANLMQPDMEVVRRYRLDGVRAELKARGYAGCILFDPINIRYAMDATNMQVWCLHNAVRYAYVATEGPVVLFDFANCQHLTDHLHLITERRNATSWFYFENGPREKELVHNWATELAHLVRSHAGSGNHRIAVDKCEQDGIEALAQLGITTIPSCDFMEHARYIKHPEEMKAVRRSINTTEIAMTEMWRQLKPGITENQLWSILHQINIARGGEWIGTRALSSGPRTNPWFAECSDRVIEAGDIISFDTDLIGPYGYCTDISRAWVTPGKVPTNEQIDLHAIAKKMLAYNVDMIKPGMTFREVADKSYRLGDEFMPTRYAAIAHGCGLADEYPAIRYPEDWEKYGYDGVVEPNTVLCFETYIGRSGGREGVKMENQVLITETGSEVLDKFSMELIPE